MVILVVVTIAIPWLLVLGPSIVFRLNLISIELQLALLLFNHVFSIFRLFHISCSLLRFLRFNFLSRLRCRLLFFLLRRNGCEAASAEGVVWEVSGDDAVQIVIRCAIRCTAPREIVTIVIYLGRSGLMASSGGKDPSVRLLSQESTLLLDDPVDLRGPLLLDARRRQCFTNLHASVFRWLERTMALVQSDVISNVTVFLAAAEGK